MSVIMVTTRTVVVVTATMGTAIALGAVEIGILISSLIGKELSTSYEDPMPTVEGGHKSLIESFTIAIATAHDFCVHCHRRCYRNRTAEGVM